MVSTMPWPPTGAPLSCRPRGATGRPGALRSSSSTACARAACATARTKRTAAWPSGLGGSSRPSASAAKTGRMMEGCQLKTCVQTDKDDKGTESDLNQGILLLAVGRHQKLNMSCRRDSFLASLNYKAIFRQRDYVESRFCRLCNGSNSCTKWLWVKNPGLVEHPNMNLYI